MGAASDPSYVCETRPSAEAAALACSLFTQHHARIGRRCRYMLRSPQDAEDALQQTFVNALRSLQAGVRPLHETAWLLQIARNVCLERQRNAGRRAQVESATSPEHLDQIPARESTTGDEAAELRAALDALAPRQQQALLLREWRGLSYEEIGTALELSQSAVETLLFRARRSLARALEDTRRLRPGLDLGGVIANLRALFSGGAAKTAVVAICCGVTIVSVPGINRAVTHRQRPAQALPARQPETPTNIPDGARARTATSRVSTAAKTKPRQSPITSAPGAPAAAGTSRPGAAGTVTGAGAPAGSPPAGHSTPGVAAAAGKPTDTGSDRPAATAPAGTPPVAAVSVESGQDTTTIAATVGNTNIAAAASVSASGSQVDAAATVDAPAGTSAGASVDASGSGTTATADVRAAGDSSADVSVDTKSGASVTITVPAVGVSTSITLPLP